MDDLVHVYYYYIVSYSSTDYTDFYLFEQIYKNVSKNDKDISLVHSIREISRLEKTEFPILIKILKNITTLHYGKTFSYNKIKVLQSKNTKLLKLQKLLMKSDDAFSAMTENIKEIFNENKIYNINEFYKSILSQKNIEDSKNIEDTKNIENTKHAKNVKISLIENKIYNINEFFKSNVHLHKETNNNEKMTIKFKSSKANKQNYSSGR